MLLETKPDLENTEEIQIDYDKLVELIQDKGGELTLKVVAVDIETKRGREFPYKGRGYAWTKRMEGTCDDCDVELNTTAVARARSWTFPYFGFGFAWEKTMEGNIDGIPLTLQAEKVARESHMAFPYLGYGRAWVQTMSGICGDKLSVRLSVTEVQKRKKYGFPYFGFGFAWPNAADLTLTLVS
jgi:hypothetical protein